MVNQCLESGCGAHLHGNMKAMFHTVALKERWSLFGVVWYRGFHCTYQHSDIHTISSMTKVWSSNANTVISRKSLNSRLNAKGSAAVCKPYLCHVLQKVWTQTNGTRKSYHNSILQGSSEKVRQSLKSDHCERMTVCKLYCDLQKKSELQT